MKRIWINDWLAAGVVLAPTLALVAILLLAPAKSQTVHPDVMWLYGLIDKLDARVKKLEDAAK